MLVEVIAVRYRSDDGRFAVLEVRREQDGEKLTMTGPLGTVEPGEMLRVRGRMQAHRVHGERFEVREFAPVTPETTEGIVRFLGSGRIPGVGPSLAQRLVDRFKTRTLDIIAEQSARLTEVDGIGPKRAQAIAEAVRAQRGDAEVLSYLQSLGLGAALSLRAKERLGPTALEAVKRDPFILAERVPGVGFKLADTVAKKAGIEDADPRRTQALLRHLMTRGADDGHVYLTRPMLHARAEAVGVAQPLVDAGIDTLLSKGQVIIEGEGPEERLYLAGMHRSERQVATRLATFAARPRQRFSAAAKTALEKTTVALTDEQKKAVQVSLEAALVIVTGGPGTGKTTTVRAIVDAAMAQGEQVLLAAPTGRAAKRLSEATGRPAQTIHRLLEWNPGTHRFARDNENPVEAQLVLIDEASMLDLGLAQSLLDAVADTTRLVLVGDVDQLPPVSPGPVLREAIKSERIEVVRLSAVFRQAQASDIVQVAHSVLHGRSPAFTQKGHSQGQGECFFIEADTPEAIEDRVVRTLSRMREAYKLDPVWDCQVLSPMRRGPAGIEHLNTVLQRTLNPDGLQQVLKGRTAEKAVLAPGDKVMQLQNDYDREVFNGDVGRVARVEGGITYVQFDGREVQYTIADLGALQLAYASTVHKVQGSEFPAALVVLHNSQYMLLHRAMLYTAITRAKRLVVVIGQRRAAQRAVQNVGQGDALCYLSERLRQALDEARP